MHSTFLPRLVPARRFILILWLTATGTVVYVLPRRQALPRLERSPDEALRRGLLPRGRLLVRNVPLLISPAEFPR